MDVETLRKYYQNGYCKELDEIDRKMMSSKKLDDYRDVLMFMDEHNCKMEQESVMAAEIQIHVFGENGLDKKHWSYAAVTNQSER